MRRRRRARGARSGPRWRGSRRQRARAARRSSWRSRWTEILDPVQCHLVRQRLRGAHGELGVVGVHRDLLELVSGDGTAGLRRLRRTPPRPATVIRAGLPLQELLHRCGQPGQQGLALPGRSPGALRSGGGRGSGGRPCGDGGGPTAARPATGQQFSGLTRRARGRGRPVCSFWNDQLELPAHAFDSHNRVLPLHAVRDAKARPAGHGAGSGRNDAALHDSSSAGSRDRLRIRTGQWRVGR